MARVKLEDRPSWALPEFGSQAGVTVSTAPITRREKSETLPGFKASPDGKTENQVILEGTTKVVAFDNLGSMVNVLTAAKVVEMVEGVINSYFDIQAKNAAKKAAFGEETAILRAIEERVAAFIQKRGTQPTDEQRTAIEAKVRATFDVDDL